MKTKITLWLMALLVLFAIIYNNNQRETLYTNTAIDAFEASDIEPTIKNLSIFLKGIDFNKPVRIYQIKKGDKFIQFQTPNAEQGNYYALEGSTPSKLGISEKGYDPKLKEVVDKTKRNYFATKDFEVLSSYSAPVVDDWSTPEIETQTEGSQLQLFTTCKPCFKRGKDDSLRP